ncbi:MAG TPA: dienelactone hydrolase family protein [Longimicrobiales bacterium]|nr:dienelactone hydrolase family protein [Longimicrobiales bacterium]
MRFRSVMLMALVATACSSNQESASTAPAAAATIVPGATQAQARLTASPRHGEWVVVKTGANDSVRAYLVYPERKSKAPVVVVIHEIFGLSNWVRSVADQLAADGFIAIAPDLLTKFNVVQTATGEPNPDSARAAIGRIKKEQYQPQIRKVAEYAMSLPAATKKYGVVGYCWGGGAVFAHAVWYPDVNAVVSYYGTTPEPADYTKVKAPVLGLYGENDARVNATIARADTASKKYKFKYEPHIFAGAGHGFLRAQDGANGANLAAAKEAWPLTVNWFRSNLK